MPSVSLRSVLVLATLAAALCAHAVTLDFENIGSGSHYNGYTDYYFTTFVEKGYVVTSTYGFVTIDATGNDGIFNHTGNQALVSYTGGVTISVRRVDGTPFNVAGLDVANSLRQSSLATATAATGVFIGLDAAGAGSSRTATPGLSNAVTHVNLGFQEVTTLLLVDLSPGLQQMQFDKIVLNPVSEPSALAALGLGAAAVLRRRRK